MRYRTTRRHSVTADTVALDASVEWPGKVETLQIQKAAAEQALQRALLQKAICSRERDEAAVRFGKEVLSLKMANARLDARGAPGCIPAEELPR